MSSYRCRWLVVLLMALTTGGIAIAQESPAETDSPAADGDKTYHDLRRSKDRTTKRFADRYFNLIKAQQWASQNGKSKITAKYVAHDPDMKWVKLETVKGSGANRVMREVTVELAKLSKTCQSRVKQIDALQKKLDELAVAEEKDDTNEAGGNESAYGEYGGRRSGEREGAAGQADERPMENPAADEGGQSRTGDGGYGEYGSPSSTPARAPQSPQSESSEPDPLGFGDVANDPPPAAPSGGPGAPGGGPSFFGLFGGAPSTASAGEAAGAGNQAAAIDRSQWKENYLAFLANFSVAPNERGEPGIDWGELSDLRGMHETVVSNLQQGIEDQYGQHTADAAQRLGEVTWSAPFADIKKLESGEQEVQFGLPPLPAPLKIRFLTDGQSAETWSAMRPGQKVTFIGRFDIRKPQEIIVRIRLAE
jgi:hypothetical protein